MRILFVTGGSPATVFAVAPLAAAARTVGHQVFMAANDDLVASITDIGIPAVSVAAQPIQHFVWTDRAGNKVSVPADTRAGLRHMGRSFARMGLAALDGLAALTADWRPDLVVGGAMAVGAPLIAARLGVPYVRHAWDTIDFADLDAGAARELAEQGYHEVPGPELVVDICPPSLRPVPLPDSRPMRWVPGNAQRRLLRWMYTRGEAAHRVLLTAGTRSFMPQNVPFLRTLVDALSTVDAEVLVAAPDDTAERLRTEISGAHIGWMPLDVVAPTCDVIFHHGGGVTALTAMNAGLPQLVAARGAYLVAASQGVADSGVGRLLDPEDSAEDIAKACLDLLSDPEYRSRAAGLAAEIAAQPTAAELVGELESLAGVRAVV